MAAPKKTKSAGAKQRKQAAKKTPAAAKRATAAASKAKGAATKAAAAGGDRVGRGTRWTQENVTLLLDTVAASTTNKVAFEQVASELGKSVGTVQQKYYNLQKAAGGAVPRRRGRTAAAARPSAAGSSLPADSQLRVLTVDELVALATRVKAEIDRRRSALDAASKLLAG